MMDVVVSTEDALALAVLAGYIEGRFPVGAEYDPERSNWTVRSGATTPFGEPYVEITSHVWSPTREAVIKAAMDAFDDYAKDKKGKLYWRKRPEIGQDHKKGWKFYMRLLISDKEAK